MNLIAIYYLCFNDTLRKVNFVARRFEKGNLQDSLCNISPTWKVGIGINYGGSSTKDGKRTIIKVILWSTLSSALIAHRS